MGEFLKKADGVRKIAILRRKKKEEKVGKWGG